MSYILEAIKRAEQQRAGAGVAGLRTLPVFVDVAKPPPLLLYGAAAAALIAAGMGIGWLRPSLPEHAAIASTTPSGASDVGAPSPAIDKEDTHRGQPTLAAIDVPRKAEMLHVMRVKPYRPPVRTTDQRATSTQVSTTAQRPQTIATPAITPAAPMETKAPADAAAAAGHTSGDAPGGTRILAQYELPQKILRDIPPMAITGFTYSDSPQGRMVDINNRLLQEGQYVADGLKLEQITRKGLVFSFRNYRFRKDMR